MQGKCLKLINGVYGANTVTANYVLLWFLRFCSDIFDVKDAARTGRFVVKNVNKKIEVNRRVSSRSIAQELNIDYKTVLNHLRKVEFKRSSMFGCHTN
ncbi:histone-lysine N-methyltransferase SETMAR [Trichonephila clavipes]|nr:histone-lysine N-methyltransferase SETMAR [Trichonephila clavipes]